MEEDHAVTIAAIVGLTAVIAVAFLLTTPTTEAVPAELPDGPGDDTVKEGLLTATDGNIRAYITDDKELVYYDRLAESLVKTGESTSASYQYLAVGGNFIAFVSPDHHLAYYDMAAGTARHTGEKFSGDTLSLEGNVITYSAGDGTVKQYDIPTDTVLS